MDAHLYLCLDDDETFVSSEASNVARCPKEKKDERHRLTFLRDLDASDVEDSEASDES